ncbi:uncharacterized protein LOC118202523 [Stegodyphus dumicola]|uniref:uncharacterized protein LOC118202523 n=1 Tax=Stegodyphus dumicola TaxID=202533 RepID=UPI0015B36F1C|nr:uncharacterized protein LOC118202523 [Stegodyphus dumicola]
MYSQNFDVKNPAMRWIETIVHLQVSLYFISGVICCHSNDLETLCDLGKSEFMIGETGKNSSGHVIFTKTITEGKTYNCSLDLIAPEMYKLVLSIEKLVLDNTCDSYLQFITTSTTAHFCKSFTGIHVFGANTLIFEDNVVKIKITKGSKARKLPAFSITYTAAEIFNGSNCIDNSSYMCNNGLCIWGKLHCDDFNNCGDFSDEICVKNTSHCSRNLPYFKMNLYAIIGLFFIVPMILILSSLCVGVCLFKWYQSKHSEVMKESRSSESEMNVFKKIRFPKIENIASRID